MEQGKHVVFYRIEKDGIVVTRILHVRMLPKLHLDDEHEE
jgi:plasmid stabilization system protein ParE